MRLPDKDCWHAGGYWCLAQPSFIEGAIISLASLIPAFASRATMPRELQFWWRRRPGNKLYLLASRMKGLTSTCSARHATDPHPDKSQSRSRSKVCQVLALVVPRGSSIVEIVDCEAKIRSTLRLFIRTERVMSQHSLIGLSMGPGVRLASFSFPLRIW